MNGWTKESQKERTRTTDRKSHRNTVIPLAKVSHTVSDMAPSRDTTTTIAVGHSPLYVCRFSVARNVACDYCIVLVYLNAPRYYFWLSFVVSLFCTFFCHIGGDDKLPVSDLFWCMKSLFFSLCLVYYVQRHTGKKEQLRISTFNPFSPM